MLKSSKQIREDIEAEADARADAYEAKWAEYNVYHQDAIARRVPIYLIEPFVQKRNWVYDRHSSLQKKRRQMRKDPSKSEAERRAEISMISAEIDALSAQHEEIPAEFHAAKMKYEAEQTQAHADTGDGGD